LQNPSSRSGSAQPRPPNDGIAAGFVMEGEPVVSRTGVLQEPLLLRGSGQHSRRSQEIAAIQSGCNGAQPSNWAGPSSTTILKSCQKTIHAGPAPSVEPRMNANGRELRAQLSPSSSSSLVPVLDFPLLPISENEDEGRGRRREIVLSTIPSFHISSFSPLTATAPSAKISVFS